MVKFPKSNIIEHKIPVLSKPGLHDTTFKEEAIFQMVDFSQNWDLILKIRNKIII
jgi:hypothetical protein